MVWSDGKWACVQEDSRPLPPVDAVSDPLSHPALVETVRDLLVDVKSQQVFVSISSSEVLLKWIQLPDAVPQTTAELQNLAIETALETENYIPVPLNSAAYDYHLMTASTLLVGWMRKGKLASVSDQLAGVELVYLTPQSVTLANQLLSEWGDSDRICGVHIDGALCDLVVVEAGELCFGRSFVIGDPSQLWQTVRQSLANCPNPTGATLKRIVLLHSAGSAQWSANASTGHKPQATGTASQLTVEQLTEQLGIDEVVTSTFDWHTALLKPIRQASGIRLNLLAPVLAESAAQQKLRRKRLLMRMIPIVALLLLLWANVKLYDATESKGEHINALRLDRAREKTLQAETKSLQERHTALEDVLAQLAWGERRFPPLAARLVQIANQCPAAVRLTEIRTVPPPKAVKAHAAFDARAVLLVIGIAPTQAEINAFRVALVTQSEFSSVRQVKTEQTIIADERWLAFTLALTSSEGGSDQLPVVTSY